jgi:hypothetical protein
MSAVEREGTMTGNGKAAAVLLAALLCGSGPALAGSSGFAVVRDDGVLNRAAHAIAAQHFGAGTYGVTFDHKVSKCVFTATTGSEGTGTAPPGFATVAGMIGDAASVFVSTYDAAGAPADRGFHLNVRC